VEVIMEILVETNFIPLVYASDPPEGVTKRIVPTREKRDIFSEPLAQMIISFGRDVGIGVMAGMIAEWLIHKIEKHPAKTYIKIEHTEVALNKGEIERVIRTVIETKKNG
jgi:hypothetical protein